MYELIVRARAIKMAKQAYQWYENEQLGLGEVFLLSLENAYLKISTHPEYFSILKKPYRQIRLYRFPYVIVYEIIKERVVVFAIHHTSRNPNSKFR